MVDLNTKYLGLKLHSPLVVSASPLSRDIDGICRLEDAGASAVVLYSLFEEQLRQEEADLNYHLAAGTESFAESLTYFPAGQRVPHRPRGISRSHPQGQVLGQHPYHRQPEQLDSGRMDEVRRPDRAGRRRCYRVQHLLHPDRSKAEARRTLRKLISTSFAR